MTWSGSVDQALCFGWIDGVRKSIDDASYFIRFTKRKPNSTWSAVNIKKMDFYLFLSSCHNSLKALWCLMANCTMVFLRQIIKIHL